MKGRILAIAMTDDDPDDRMLMSRALRTAGVENPVLEFSDGDELLNYLEKPEGRDGEGRPGLIILDLNMPRVGGHEVLSRLKADEHVRTIPVIVFTTSDEQEEMVRSYELGAASFITKPMTYGDMLDAFDTIRRYWLRLAMLP